MWIYANGVRGTLSGALSMLATDAEANEDDVSKSTTML